MTINETPIEADPVMAADDTPSPTGAAPEEPGERSGLLGPVILLGLLVLLAVQVGPGALAIVLGFIFIMFMHELGHFVAARRAGMKVTQFFLGMGPTLWSTRRGETEYGIKGFPIGAFVRIIGMNNLDPVDPAEEHRSYRTASYAKRMSVVLAGSAMHFAMAFVALLVLHGGIGWFGPSEPLPDVEPWAIEEVFAGEPAAEMGMEVGDKVIAVDGYELRSFNELVFIVRESAGQTVDFTVDRAGQEVLLSGRVGARPVEGTDVSIGTIGIKKGQVADPRKGVVDTVTTSVKDFGVFTKDSVRGVTALPGFLAEKLGFSRDAEPVVDDGTPTSSDGGGEDPLSVVGIVRAGDEFVDFFGWTVLGGLFVAVNIFLGVFNLLPMLPFDGGHAVIATYERIRSIGGQRHHADVAKLMPLTYMTIAAIMLLMGVTVYNDIFNFTLFSS